MSYKAPPTINTSTNSSLRAHNFSYYFFGPANIYTFERKMAQILKHAVPTILWGTGETTMRKEKTWALTTYYNDISSGTNFRLTAGNKIYALSGSKIGEFDASKKVGTSDLGLYKKYR